MKNRGRTRSRLSIVLAGCVCLPGCSSQPANYTNTGPATIAYVWGDNYPTYDGGPAQTVLAYSTTQLQASSPLGALTLPTTCNGGPIVMDSLGQLYIGCFSSSGPPQILVYAPNSTGEASPSRTIQMGSSSYEITTLTVDANGLLYVGALEPEPETTNTVQFTLTVYASGARGQAAPLRTIALRANNGLIDVALDAVGNIYVAGYPPYVRDEPPVSYVDVYSSDPFLSAPVRTIDFPFFIYGVGADDTGNVYVSAGTVTDTQVSALEEFAPDASGYASPINIINLPEPLAGLEMGGGPVRLDGAGNIFTPVAMCTSPCTNGSYMLYRFAAPAFAKAIPVALIAPKEGYNTSFALN